MKLLRTWDSFELSGELPGYDRLLTFSSNLDYRRWVSNFLNFYGGGRASDEFSGSKVRAVLGVTYTLPFLIESDASVDSAGNASLNLEKRLEWTSKFYSDLGFYLKNGGGVKWKESNVLPRVALGSWCCLSRPSIWWGIKTSILRHAFKIK